MFSVKYKTRQQLFDNAYKGVIAQGRPAYNDATDSCMYRGPDNTKCGIGHSIPDYKYRKSLENRGATASEVMAAANINPDDMTFARQLQGCHDNAAIGTNTTRRFLESFNRRMTALAQSYSLEVPNV